MIFKHFRTKEHGSITVCGEFIRDQAFAMGVAFCSPKEKIFSKKVGRYIAEGRMRSFLDKPQATFGRCWNPVCGPDGQDTEQAIKQIKRGLCEVEGPQWYPEFLKELFKIDRKREMRSTKEKIAEHSNELILIESNDCSLRVNCPNTEFLLSLNDCPNMMLVSSDHRGVIDLDGMMPEGETRIQLFDNSTGKSITTWFYR